MSFSQTSSTSARPDAERATRVWLLDAADRLATVWAHVRLGRPSDSSFAFVGTVLGAALAGGAVWSERVLAVALSNALLSAASMAINDWRDVAEDRVNRPDRPIPSGRVPRSRALAISAVLFVAGMSLAWSAGAGFGLRAAAVALLSTAYTLRMKRWPIAGNVTTALLSSYPIWCWAFDSQTGSLLFWMVCASYFLATVGKEMVRTAADVPGDASAGICTVGTLVGSRRANCMGVLVIACAALVAWVPLWRHEAANAYVAAVAIATIAGLGLSLWQLVFGTRDRDTSRRIILIARAATVLIAAAIAWDVAR